MNTSFAGGEREGGMVGQMGMTTDNRSLFTVSQWQELEHQALIFKYMTAGLPVPADLLLPIQKSFESISHRFLHHPTMNYYSFYGKKVDPEPGRCRRTDGKKWRCSKDAYPDSKYCERHMQRGRNRSRKPVESQQTVTGSSSATGNFQTLPLSAYGSSQGTASGTSQSHYQSESFPYGIPNKDYRHLQGLRASGASGEHSLFSEAGISNVDFQINAPSNYSWPVMPSTAPFFPPLKSSDLSVVQSKNPKSLFFGSEYGSGENAKPESQYLQPFFEEWPRNRDCPATSTSSSTQLSISIPMSSSDFSATSSRSSLEH